MENFNIIFCKQTNTISEEYHMNIVTVNTVFVNNIEHSIVRRVIDIPGWVAEKHKVMLLT